jgi:hypothetical protein
MISTSGPQLSTSFNKTLKISRNGPEVVLELGKLTVVDAAGVDAETWVFASPGSCRFPS